MSHRTRLFAILQKYEFSSKSQLIVSSSIFYKSCLRYCKSTSFQANHNYFLIPRTMIFVVCDTAKVRVFKQITTSTIHWFRWRRLFAILQKYEFSSKSQQKAFCPKKCKSCLRYCKSTSFQANHNRPLSIGAKRNVVCDTAKVRVFKQITTAVIVIVTKILLFAILQKYEFSSKSQRLWP